MMVKAIQNKCVLSINSVALLLGDSCPARDYISQHSLHLGMAM